MIAGIVLLVILVAAETALRLYFGSTLLYRHYRWIVETHLIDMSYSEHLRRQERIRAVRERLGQERGRRHPVFGWTYNPGFRIDEADLGLQIEINSHGLRGEEFPAEKPEGEIRILCLGGSTTAGEDVREAQTYPAQLQAILRERLPGWSIRVINGAVPTYSTKESFRHVALRLHRFGADFVTFYHGINDLFYHGVDTVEVASVPNYNGHLLAPFVFEGDASQRVPFRQFFRSLLKQSLLVTLTYDGLKELGLVGSEPAVMSPRLAGIATFEAYARALMRHIAATGATPVPITFAIAYPGDFVAADRKKIAASLAIYGPHILLAAKPEIIDQQNRVLIALAREQSAPLCDVAGALPPDRRHFIDACHLTERGNRRIAETLADTLVPLIEQRRRARAAGGTSTISHELRLRAASRSPG